MMDAGVDMMTAGTGWVVFILLAGIIAVAQVFTLVEAVRHVIYTVKKTRPKQTRYKPKTALISPCKGLDTTFDRNIRALFEQDYPAYEIFFVVESEEDEAYERLEGIIEEYGKKGAAARILIAGKATQCAQKIHNLLAACRVLPEDVEVLAFIDSDACPGPEFLARLVHPLRRGDVGAATGYRWFVPEDGRLSSKMLSAMNAWVASMMGPHNWNSAWGGAMAIRRELFVRTELERLWGQACSDDYTLTDAVKRSCYKDETGKERALRVEFEPSCFVPSYEAMSWREVFSFARRQFIITRVCMPKLWGLAVVSLGGFLGAFWGGLAVGLGLAEWGSAAAWTGLGLAGFVYVSTMVKGGLRQVLIGKIFAADRKKLRGAAVLDVFCQPVVAAFTLGTVLAAAWTNRIVWRGTTYVLRDLHHTEVERQEG